MSTATVIAYLVTFAACYFSIAGFPQVIVAGLIVRMGGGQMLLIAAVIGGIVSWLLVAFLWKYLEGRQIPIAALVGAILFIVMHGQISRDKLTQQSIQMMVAEVWGIIIVGITVAVSSNSIRWY